MNNNEYIELIKSNIDKCGYHIYIIKDIGPLPRFGYSIGLKEELGVELILAGALLYSDEEIKTILDEIIIKLKENSSSNIITTTLGIFSIRNVDKTWVKELMLGVLDYYNIDTIKTLQILPMNEYSTIDIPNLSKKYNPDTEPIWKWLTEDWILPIPSTSICVTDFNTLRGEPILEAIRWEDNYWEVFSHDSCELIKENTKFIPLGIILGSNLSNEIISTLSINEGISRTSINDEWEIWDVKE